MAKFEFILGRPDGESVHVVNIARAFQHRYGSEELDCICPPPNGILTILTSDKSTLTRDEIASRIREVLGFTGIKCYDYPTPRHSFEESV